ncbi:hypothetical protein SRB17_88210 [Streptomyces sp. RB17]|uniref:DUF4265 domain-containing protein n=1 Tax=Streptomyces sp. RB17 TaxID=2585197 RepID=UPI0012967EA2|nr:DUF4265 domain-containing protein [Streptomyces sp. RB17]MQY40788.1 hypothetical protein [Streptomyces sp. RB17]
MACPPLTYGICYRDVVTIDSLARVVHKSGHRALRVALVVEHADQDQVHELLHGKAVDTGLPLEWLQGAYLAVDFPPGSGETPFVEVLEPFAQADALYWEIDS